MWGTWAEAITTIMVDLGLRDTVINLGPDYFPPVTRRFLVGIFLLMGVAPLAAWRRSTAQRLGRAMLIPAVLAVAVLVALIASGHDDLWALAGYGLVSFVGFATLTEIVKGVRARHRRGEAYSAALVRLIGRDRHRYGGYFIHLGMVILGIGVIGSTAYQKTTTQTLNVGDRMSLNEYTMQYNGLYEARGEDGRTMVIARATVYKDGKIVDHIRPRRDIFMTTDPATGDAGTPARNMSIPGTYSTIEGDFYARIEHWEGNRSPSGRISTR